MRGNVMEGVLATIRDVAKACGVSAMTVSAVLNNRQGAASSNTRDRVLRVVEELGYHPNALARGLSRKTMQTVGVVLVSSGTTSIAADRYFGPILDGVFDKAKQADQRVLIITEETWEAAYDKLPSYFDGHCDGLLFVLPTISNEFLVSVQRQDVPFVILGESRPMPTLSVVDLDNIAAGYDATTFLLQNGHRRIALFKGDAYFASSGLREEGYKKALTEWGAPVEDGLVYEGRYSADSGYACMLNLLKSPAGDLPTAVFCADDWIAMGAIQALDERGLSVPSDMSIVGVNDNKESSTWSPGLTTISQPLRSLGQRATEMVLDQIRNGRKPGVKALVRGEIVTRGSVSTLAAPTVTWSKGDRRPRRRLAGSRLPSE